ncbi:acyltransferase [Croceicoccus ponticola]|uniref:Acyltransferase n=1 Tax=Croceicoccus ponticola TaxID=2217664 RepID=A0A437GWD6_9SPHN|nr:acyltransferase [Croceicoccus ponticola]RVQ66409.1 acyltransferase [Croceicoccus ponticola]
MGTATTRGAGYITHLHAFRGIAIILIVGAHALSMTFWKLGVHSRPNPDMVLLALCETIAHNSTIFFALISGLLFSVILAGRGWSRFFKNKFLNVILPYCLFSVLFTMFNWHFINGLQVFSGSPVEFVSESGINILWGRAAAHFWYIPVLAVLFLLTPALSWLMDRRWALAALAVMLIAPMFVSRTFPDNSVQNVIVFLAPYTFGIWLGARYEDRIAMVQRLAVPLTVVTALASVATFALFYFEYGPLMVAWEDPEGPINWFETASYVQKMALACIVLLWLRSRGEWMPRWLDLLAVNAFAIYFIYFFMLMTFYELVNQVVTAPPPPLIAGLVALAVWAGVLALCVGISVTMQKLLGHRSRMIIGA